MIDYDTLFPKHGDIMERQADDNGRRQPTHTPPEE